MTRIQATLITMGFFLYFRFLLIFSISLQKKMLFLYVQTEPVDVNLKQSQPDPAAADHARIMCLR